MKTSSRLALAAVALAASAALAQGLDPAALQFTKVEDIPWVDSPAGTSAQARIYGDPSKPGPYALFNKWKAGNMSRPHFHPNDRHIVVLKGTWWVGTGERFDPDSTVPMPAGTYVLHTGKHVHYDGAKDGDVILLIHGEGPGTSTPAEKK